MHWDDTIASTCRYGEIAARIFGDAEIIWERSEASYQGGANVLARMPDGAFIHYEWTYGSCSGCDEWESRGLSDDEIEAEMRSALAVLPDIDTCARYVRGDVSPETPYPNATELSNGGLPGMLRALSGGIGDEFREMGEAFAKWRERAGNGS